MARLFFEIKTISNCLLHTTRVVSLALQPEESVANLLFSVFFVMLRGVACDMHTYKDNGCAKGLLGSQIACKGIVYRMAVNLRLFAHADWQLGLFCIVLFHSCTHGFRLATRQTNSLSLSPSRCLFNSASARKLIVLLLFWQS